MLSGQALLKKEAEEAKRKAAAAQVWGEVPMSDEGRGIR